MALFAAYSEGIGSTTLPSGAGEGTLSPLVHPLPPPPASLVSAKGGRAEDTTWDPGTQRHGARKPRPYIRVQDNW